MRINIPKIMGMIVQVCIVILIGQVVINAISKTYEEPNIEFVPIHEHINTQETQTIYSDNTLLNIDKTIIMR